MGSTPLSRDAKLLRKVFPYSELASVMGGDLEGGEVYTTNYLRHHSL